MTFAFNAYRIETPRLVLRCWSPEDRDRMKAAEDASREHLRRYLPWADRAPETLDEIVAKLRRFRAAFDKGEDFMFGVFDRMGEIVGSCGAHARVGAGALEIGYWVHAAHLRKGIATEAAGALTRVCFEVAGCKRVEIHCARSNVASAAVPRRLGFHHDATLRERVAHPRGEVEDEEVFSLLARELAESGASAIAVRAYDAAGKLLFMG